MNKSKDEVTFSDCMVVLDAMRVAEQRCEILLADVGRAALTYYECSSAHRTDNLRVLGAAVRTYRQSEAEACAAREAWAQISAAAK